ncbi:unnamed protein product [Schistosoma turkestanicum]|nr:unnamed protein product [Schistosoma turkestanicum]
MEKSPLKSSSFEFPIGVIRIPVSLSGLTEVDANGLPRLPVSVACYARFRRLLHIKHHNLCRYLDVVREKGEILSIVCEYYSTSFSNFSSPVTDANWLSKRFNECLSALCFMNDNGLVHCCLTPDMIMLDFDGHVKIGGYGIYYATDWGNTIDFTLPSPMYAAPEVFLLLCNQANDLCQPKRSTKYSKCWVKIEADVWSLGVIFFELIFGKGFTNPLRKLQNENVKKSEIISLLLKGLCHANKYPTLPEFLQLHLNSISTEVDILVQLIQCCLRFDAITRPNPKYLIKEMNKLLQTNCYMSSNTNGDEYSKPWCRKIYDHSRKCEFHPQLFSLEDNKNNISKAYNFIKSIDNLSELYYYWMLTGGKIHSTLNGHTDTKSIRDNYHNRGCKEESIIKKETLSDTSFECLLPPIFRIPHYLAIVQSDTSRTMSLEEQWPPGEMPQPRTFQFRITPLPSEYFIERISHTPLQNLHPLLICQDLLISSIGNSSVCSALYSVINDNNTTTTTIENLSNTSRLNEYSRTISNSPLFGLTQKRSDFLDLLYKHDITCTVGINWSMPFTNNQYESIGNTISQQPLSVRETDVDYQIYRTRLFTRILNGLPATKQYLRLEARKDIPPFLRCKVWAALLDVYPNRDFESAYLKTLHKINKLGLDVTPTNELNNNGQYSTDNNNNNNNDHNNDSTTNSSSSSNNNNNNSNAFNCDLLDEKVINQISVDLPRCHAYDPLLASSIGQSVLRRVLLATLLMKPGALDYTQGMDSVAAVFVRICYPDEALAAACLDAFLSTKLPGFFSSGGLTVGLKSYFNTLLRLLAFHVPRLAVRLVDINVPLIGLTTGWIYTLFAHAMPLDRIELLWDTIIPGPASLSMFFYIAFFIQLDKQINFESLGLEKICTILSNFPDINLDKCRTDALKLALATPRSLTAWSIPNRQYLYQKTTLGNEELAVEHLNSKRKELSTCDFYERLTLQNAWPDHLEYDFTDLLEYSDVNFSSNVCEELNISTNAFKLVPLLSVKDAVEHIKRPDCLVLDVRNIKEFNKNHFPNSIHCETSMLAMLDSLSVGVEESHMSLNTTDSYNNLSLENWEMIDYPSGNRHQPQIIPEFLAFLINQKLWHQATQARLSSSNKSSQGVTKESTNILISSPGLLIVFGNEERLCWHLAFWLIKCNIDRVCILFSSSNSISNFLNSCSQ